jgi:hypothetical protein
MRDLTGCLTYPLSDDKLHITLTGRVVEEGFQVLSVDEELHYLRLDHILRFHEFVLLGANIEFPVFSGGLDSVLHCLDLGLGPAHLKKGVFDLEGQSFLQQ